MAGALVLGVAFIVSYIGVMHGPTARDVPIGIVRSDTTAAAFLAALRTRSDDLAARSFSDARAATEALDQRRVYAVLTATPDQTSTLRLTVAGAAAPGVADFIRQSVSAAAGAAKIDLTVRDERPTTDRDSRGLTAFYLVTGLILGGWLAAAALVAWPVPHRLAVLAAFALLQGMAGALVVDQFYHVWSHHLVMLWLVGALVTGAAATTCAALIGWLGPLVGAGAALVPLLVLTPAGYPPELLPTAFRALQWLPTCLGTRALTGIQYFGGPGTGILIGLGGWTVAGTIAALARGTRVDDGAGSADTIPADSGVLPGRTRRSAQ